MAVVPFDFHRDCCIRTDNQCSLDIGMTAPVYAVHATTPTPLDAAYRTLTAMSGSAGGLVAAEGSNSIRNLR